VYHDNYFRYFMFGKYNGFVGKARVSACMYYSWIIHHTPEVVYYFFIYLRMFTEDRVIWISDFYSDLNQRTINNVLAISWVLIYAWPFTLVVRIGDFHCIWSLLCKMLCLSEMDTIDRRWITISVNQALTMDYANQYVFIIHGLTYF
jgi:hypothetical protein